MAVQIITANANIQVRNSPSLAGFYRTIVLSGKLAKEPGGSIVITLTESDTEILRELLS